MGTIYKSPSQEWDYISGRVQNFVGNQKRIQQEESGCSEVLLETSICHQWAEPKTSAVLS